MQPVTLTAVLIALGAFVLAMMLTGLVRRAALSGGMMDVPNERSSHTVPTARGGGLATVLANTAALAALTVSGAMSMSMFMALGIGGATVAAVGYVDDRRSLSAIKRLAVHFCAGAWALFWLDGPVTLQIGDEVIVLGWAGQLLALLGVVWTLNLFNFMDGIDGLAGSEAVFIALAASLILLARGEAFAVSAIALVFAAATAGFLWWNWPPAKIFMGDVGSGYMGYFVAVMGLIAAREDPLALWIWLVLGGLFFADATVTLLVRLAQGQRAHEAHRTHAYQILTRRWNSHKQVTALAICANLFWLLPFALLAVRYPHRAGWLVLIALLPVAACVWACGAGRR